MIKIITKLRGPCCLSMQSGLLPTRGRVIPSVKSFLPVLSTSSAFEHLRTKKQHSRSVRMNGIPVSAVAAAAPPTRLKTYTASEMSEADLVASTARPRVDFNDILETVSSGCHQTPDQTRPDQAQIMNASICSAINVTPPPPTHHRHPHPASPPGSLCCSTVRLHHRAAR